MQQVSEERESQITFTPSRVEWIAEVNVVTVRPNGLELETADGTREIRFSQIGKLQESRIVHRFKRLIGVGPKAVIVGDRDWFHPPQDRFFRFYTDPPLTVYMPPEETHTYAESLFCRVQAVMQLGGYITVDLG